MFSFTWVPWTFFNWYSTYIPTVPCSLEWPSCLLADHSMFLAFVAFQQKLTLYVILFCLRRHDDQNIDIECNKDIELGARVILGCWLSVVCQQRETLLPDKENSSSLLFLANILSLDFPGETLDAMVDGVNKKMGRSAVSYKLLVDKMRADRRRPAGWPTRERNGPPTDATSAWQLCTPFPPFLVQAHLKEQHC